MHNFSRRSECYRCSAPRGENAIAVSGPQGNPSSSDVLSDSALSSDQPSCFLAVRGYGPYITEEAIIELFRQFAQVKSVYLLRDRVTGISRGVSYVEFHTVEHATHTVQQSALGNLHLDSSPLKISYARESFRMTQITKDNEALQQQQQQAVLGQASQGYSPAPATAPVQAGSGQWQQANNNTGYAGSSQKPGLLPPPAPKVKPQFPPSFETDGGAYVFQAQSANFLEPISQYFYCPKSKLYYCCTDGIYYHCYSTHEGASFVRYNPPLPLGPEEAVSTAATAKAVSDEAALARKPVILSMGFGGMKKSATAKKNTGKMSSDVQKWANLQDEDEDDSKELLKIQGNMKGKGKSHIAEKIIISNAPIEEIIVLPPVIQSLPPPPPPVLPPSSAPVPVPAVDTSLVACLLCRRQFASPEQLQRHEKESKLHKENMILAVKAAADDVANQLAAFSKASAPPQDNSRAPSIPTATPSSSEGYRDRASERRAIHYQEDGPGLLSQSEIDSRNIQRERELRFDWLCGKCQGHNFARRSECYRCSGPRGENAVRTDTQGNPNKNETDNSNENAAFLPLNDQANPGSQMLRKMGWNEGQGLGRDGSGLEESVGVQMGSDLNSSTGRRVTGIGGNIDKIPHVNYSGSGKEYKDSLIRAAKARYDQINK
mmetsp:Transcript_20787/g.20144  ORF Transcript_20787/g.20144 Transcript_20787/m.20144 type:complete len:659 (+) Transcript_20787:639-2615(+)